MSLICALLVLAVLPQRFLHPWELLLGAQVLLKKVLPAAHFFCNFAPCEVVSPFFLNGDVNSTTREHVA